MVDYTQHQGDTATPNRAAVHHQRDRLCCQILQQRLRNWQEPAFQCLRVMFEPATEALDQAFLLGAVAGCVIGDSREMRPLAAGQATDQGRQGVEVPFAVAAWLESIELHQRAFYGTIASIRVAHGAPPDCDRSCARRSIPWLARITF
jgi:hypothetical protein